MDTYVTSPVNPETRDTQKLAETVAHEAITVSERQGHPRRFTTRPGAGSFADAASRSSIRASSPSRIFAATRGSGHRRPWTSTGGVRTIPDTPRSWMA
jgi:hypothetical protein